MTFLIYGERCEFQIVTNDFLESTVNYLYHVRAEFV